MRYDKPVYFQKRTPGAYDPTAGNYAEDTVTENKLRAAVTDSGVETMKLIYDGIKQGTKIVRLQRPYTQPFDSIRIRNKIYRVDFSRYQKTFVVSEVDRCQK